MENNLRERIEGMVEGLNARLKDLKIEKKSLMVFGQIQIINQVDIEITSIEFIQKKLQTILDETK